MGAGELTAPRRRVSLNLLLGLHAFEVGDQIGDSLLNLPFMSLADAGEQSSPNGHLLAAVGRIHGLPLEHCGNVSRGILSAIIFRHLSQIGGRGLHCRRCRTVAFGIFRVANGAIAVIHRFARIRRSTGDGHMFDRRLIVGGRLLRYGKRRDDDQNCRQADEFFLLGC